jgi:hypothetical protein
LAFANSITSFHSFERAVGLHDAAERVAAEQDDGCEVLDRVVGRFLDVGHAIDRNGDVQERVAVGFDARHIGGCERAAAARLVLDDDRLPQVLADRLPIGAHENVARHAGRRWDDHRHGPRGEIGGALRGGNVAAERKRRQSQRTASDRAQTHVIHSRMNEGFNRCHVAGPTLLPRPEMEA